MRHSLLHSILPPKGNINFPCSADHEQDWQPYPVDPYSAICDDYTPYNPIQCIRFGTVRLHSSVSYSILYTVYSIGQYRELLLVHRLQILYFTCYIYMACYIVTSLSLYIWLESNKLPLPMPLFSFLPSFPSFPHMSTISINIGMYLIFILINTVMDICDTNTVGLQA